MLDNFANYPSLKDKTVIITGGSQGIGMEMVKAFAQQGSKIGIVDLDAFLGHGIAFAHSDGAFKIGAILTDCIEVDGHAVRRADLILTTVTPTDGTAFVVEDVQVRAKEFLNFPSLA